MQSTVLTPIPVDSVHDTLFIPGALVVDDGALGTPEEAFAALAGYHAVMYSGRFIAAHFAGDDFDLRCNEEKEKNKLVNKFFLEASQ